MFADNTNLFYWHQYINTLFSTINVKLEKIEQWFKANKLSLNIKKTVESKIVKNIGLLHRVRQLLNEASLKTICFSYMHSYLNYENIAWASINVAKLNKIHTLQKRSVHIVLNKDFRSKENVSLSHARLLLWKTNAIFQINIYQHITFMHKCNNIQAPNIFHDIIKNCSTKTHRISQAIFSLQKVYLKLH